jgi:hypothetical protein
VKNLKAGLAYFAVMFTVGFVLGALRVGLVAPRIGDLAAVLIELPLILAASWFVCRRLTAILAIAARVPDRLAMGALAFTLLIITELALAGPLFGRSLSQSLTGMATDAGLLGLAGQILFGLVPLLQLRRRR